MSTKGDIDKLIDGYGDWRSQRLRELQAIINQASPELTEDFKWGVPVWTSNGLVCAISGFKNNVKLNFFKGVALPDPRKMFNSGLDSKEHRSINFARDDKIDPLYLTQLVKTAVELNKKG